jgi:hypothetical protein
MAACRICQHARRAEIDQSLSGGISLRTLEAQYHLSRSALHRHQKEHLMSQDHDRAVPAADETSATSAWQQLMQYAEQLIEHADHADPRNHLRQVIQNTSRILPLLVQAAARQAGESLALPEHCMPPQFKPGKDGYPMNPNSWRTEGRDPAFSAR